MKRVSSLIMASGVLVLFGYSSAYAVPAVPAVPEPGTMTVLGALAAGGFIARKIIKRK